MPTFLVSFFEHQKWSFWKDGTHTNLKCTFCLGPTTHKYDAFCTICSVLVTNLVIVLK